MSQILKNKVVRFILGLPYTYPEDDNHKTIAVLIPAYNEEKTIGDTIRSLKNQTKLPDEIIVVDDCSQDRTGEIAKNLGAKVIRLEKNSGTKSQAQNAGLPYINSDIVITVDADTVLDHEAIENIIKPLSDPNIASVCGLVIPQKIETIWERSRFIEYLFGITLNKQAQQNMGAILVSSGCFSAFIAKELQANGGFQRRTCAEDLDYTWARLIEGKKIAFQKNAICFPLDPPNWKIYQRQVMRWYSAFFENISIYKRDIWKNKKLAFFVGWYLIEGLIFMPLMLVLFFYLLRANWVLSPLAASNWLLIVVFSLWAAHRMKKKFLVIKSLPCFFLISFLNTYLFYKAFVQEWICHRKIEIWEKGH